MYFELLCLELNMANTNYMKDNGKYPLVMAQVMLSYLCLWPLNKSLVIKILRYIILINTLIMGISHIYYMLLNITDMAVMSNTCTTVSTTIQTSAKIFLIGFYSDELAEILTVMFEEFWPADIAGISTERSIKNGSRVIVIMVCIYLSTAFMSCWDFMAIHLVFGRRNLPLDSSFPFDWQKSTLFEVLYVWQFIINMFTVIHTIGVHDFFFNALVTNCISQFKLLSTALESIGTGEDKKINQRLNLHKNKIKNTGIFFKHETFDNIKEDEEYELVKKCVAHHNLVLNICDKLQNIYGAMILLQFFLSATALCVSSFVLTQFEDYKSKMISFSTAHLMQFFFLCTVGNELIYQSANVADGSYASKWYNTPNLQVRKALVLIIQRAQREQKITALGFANLDYPNFVNVLRLSFSFYTLLGSLKE